MKKIQLTGATGFVGINLTEYLDKIFEVTPLTIRFKENQKIDLFADCIIHAAGKAHDTSNISDKKEYIDSNFELTKQLFDAFLNSNASKFIFISSIKAVADSSVTILDETAIPNPLTPYGCSKKMAEDYILSQPIPSGKKIFIVRPCMIHGKGNKGNLNLLYQLVSKGLPWPLGDFHNQRSFLSIENLCFILFELINNQTIPDGIYHLADDEPLSTNQLIEIIGISMNKKTVILKIPTFIIRGISKIGDYTKLPINSERLQKLTENYVICNSKIKQAIGKSLPINSKEGMLTTFNSFKINV
jgi:nucleoside-diphosphate-sugar epimerase